MEATTENRLGVIRSLESHYRTGRASLANEFFEPCLQNCSLYRRAAGYFSSSALVTWIAALPRLALSHDVSIKVIASHKLSAEDIEVLKNVVDPERRRQHEAVIVERIIEDIIRLAEEPGDQAVRAKIFAWLLGPVYKVA